VPNLLGMKISGAGSERSLPAGLAVEVPASIAETASVWRKSDDEQGLMFEATALGLARAEERHVQEPTAGIVGMEAETGPQTGASGPRIADATDWAPHTVRGFLAGLANKGITVEVLERVRQVGHEKAGARAATPSTALSICGGNEPAARRPYAAASLAMTMLVEVARGRRSRPVGWDVMRWKRRGCYAVPRNRAGNRPVSFSGRAA
jgi:hypothetical protein